MTILTPKRNDLTLYEGQGFADVYPWANDQGFSYWYASRAYAKNAVVKAWPDSEGALFFRATTGGAASSTPPTWPTFAGGTVTDGSVVWTAQTDSSYPVDLTTATSAVWEFRSAPDAPGPALITLSSGSGLVLGGSAGTIARTLTPAQVAQLLAVGEYGAQSLAVTFSGPDPETALYGNWNVRRMAAGR